MDDATISLWDIDHDTATARIEARRKRIRNRLDAAKRLTTLIKIGHMFSGGTDSVDPSAGVASQCTASRKGLELVLENGLELVANVRIAADHLQTKHRLIIERRNLALETLLSEEEAESKEAVEVIEASWPSSDKTKKTSGIPSELFAKILVQKDSCNFLLEKKNDLITELEGEVRNCDDQYKLLVDEYHENIAVMSTRMEEQIQTLEAMVVTERGRLLEAAEKQRAAAIKDKEDRWQSEMKQLDQLSEGQMEKRLNMLTENENELNSMVTEDAVAFLEMKHALEDSIEVLSNQIQFVDSVHQLNEERLDYEIHVLRKHEEEIVLVKSEQKRKITTLQDTINKLRQKAAQALKDINKEESNLHSAIAEVHRKLRKLSDLEKSHSRSARKQRDEILDMVREETMEKIGPLLAFDHELRVLCKAKDSKRANVYLEPLIERDMRRRKPTAASESWSSPTNGEDEFKDEIDQQIDIKTFLSNLIRNANFLVEENLNVLVEADDITEREKNLFRLDSILAAIGVEAENQIIGILRQRKDKEKATEDVIKFIRGHLEVTTGTSTSSSASSHSSPPQSEAALTKSSAASSATSTSSGAEFDHKWDVMVSSVEAITTEESAMLKELQALQADLKTSNKLKEENLNSRRQIEELSAILSKIKRRNIMYSNY